MNQRFECQFSLADKILGGALCILTSALLFTAGNLSAQTVDIENFDSLAVPNLPVDWRSRVDSTTPAPSAEWVTSSSVPVDTAPNAARHVPVAAINGGRAQLNSHHFRLPDLGDIRLYFRHAFKFESTFDGGKFFINGLDSASAVNCYDGGYNQTMSNLNPFFGGTKAWSGDSGGFIATSCNIANLRGQIVDFAWVAAYDPSIITSPPGWTIDSIQIEPAAGLIMTQSASPNPARAGQPLVFTTTVTNQGPSVATNLLVRQVLPRDSTFVSSTTTLGVSLSAGATVRTTMPSLPNGATVTITTTVQVAPNPTGDDMLFTSDHQETYSHQFGLRKLGFSPDLPQAPASGTTLRAFDFFNSSTDGCEIQVYMPSQTAGRVGLASAGTCPLVTKALNMQNKGFPALIIEDLAESLVDPNEASTDIAIPTVLLGKSDFADLMRFQDQGMKANLVTLPNTLASITSVRASQFNPNEKDEYSAMFLGVIFPEPELIAKLESLNATLKKLKAGSSNQRRKAFNKNKNNAKAQVADIVGYLAGIGSSIQPLDGTTSLGGLAATLRTSVNKLRNNNKLSKNRKKSLSLLSSLLGLLPRR